MALAHKGLSAETIPWCFTEKSAIAPHGSEKVPVLLDGDRAVVDSWTIANYLEDTYPTGRRCSAARAAVRWGGC
jgi:glutathione S-transferase